MSLWEKIAKLKNKLGSLELAKDVELIIDLEEPEEA